MSTEKGSRKPENLRSAYLYQLKKSVRKIRPIRAPIALFSGSGDQVSWILSRVSLPEGHFYVGRNEAGYSNVWSEEKSGNVQLYQRQFLKKITLQKSPHIHVLSEDPCSGR